MAAKTCCQQIKGWSAVKLKSMTSHLGDNLEQNAQKSQFWLMAAKEYCIKTKTAVFGVSSMEETFFRQTGNAVHCFAAIVENALRYT